MALHGRGRGRDAPVDHNHIPIQPRSPTLTPNTRRGPLTLHSALIPILNRIDDDLYFYLNEETGREAA